MSNRTNGEGGGVAVGFFSVPLVFDRILHCGRCGSPSVPLDRSTGLTLCCGADPCRADGDGMLLIGPFGKRYCCEGVARRNVGPGLIELRTRNGDVVVKQSQAVLPVDESEDPADVPKGAGRERARAIRRLKKKLALNKISPEDYAAEMDALQ